MDLLDDLFEVDLFIVRLLDAPLVDLFFDVDLEPFEVPLDLPLVDLPLEAPFEALVDLPLEAPLDLPLVDFLVPLFAAPPFCCFRSFIKLSNSS